MGLANEIRRMQGTLIFARKLLTFAIFVQLPVFVVVAARQIDLPWTFSLKLFWLINGASCLAGIVGFVIACRQLNLIDETLEDSPIPGFIQEGRFPGSGRVLASAQLLFYALFIMPMVNALLFLWARWKAQSAIEAIDAALERLRRAPRAQRPVTVL
jgi:hypothetical protein